MAREPLSSVDTAWLRMEDPTNLMMIGAVMVFGAPMDFERLKVTLTHRLLRFDRFRQRVVQPRLPLGRPYWEDDPAFDLDFHVQRATLSPPGDEAALQALASLLMSTPLDFSRPLWQVHLVEKYGAGCALIVRLHHCIADGIALLRVLLSTTDRVPDAPWPTPETGTKLRRDPGLLHTFFRPMRKVMKTTTRVTGALLQEGLETLINPTHALNLVQMGTSSATALARLALLPPDPPTAFKGELGVDKRAAWSEPVPLKEVKTIGRAMGATVNDVLLTAVAGALRRYLQEHDAPADDVDLRAVVPVNLRSPDTAPELGNRFGLVFLTLPVSVADPNARLKELKRRMDQLKDSPEAMVILGLLNAVGMTPSEIQDVVINIFGSKATAVMTNLPGPRETLYLAGAPLDTLMFWVPQSGRLGIGVSIISYARRVWLGLVTDAGLVPDPEAILDGFHDELDALLNLAREAKKRPPPRQAVQTMLTQLDEAIATLDGLLAESPKSGDVEASPDRCQALTKAGRPCKNRPMSGSRFCHVHQDYEPTNT